jgi:hypothetical protein
VTIAASKPASAFRRLDLPAFGPPRAITTCRAVAQRPALPAAFLADGRETLPELRQAVTDFLGSEEFRVPRRESRIAGRRRRRAACMDPQVQCADLARELAGERAQAPHARPRPTLAAIEDGDWPPPAPGRACTLWNARSLNLAGDATRRAHRCSTARATRRVHERSGRRGPVQLEDGPRPVKEFGAGRKIDREGDVDREPAGARETRRTDAWRAVGKAAAHLRRDLPRSSGPRHAHDAMPPRRAASLPCGRSCPLAGVTAAPQARTARPEEAGCGCVDEVARGSAGEPGVVGRLVLEGGAKTAATKVETRTHSAAGYAAPREVDTPRAPAMSARFPATRPSQRVKIAWRGTAFRLAAQGGGVDFRR